MRLILSFVLFAFAAYGQITAGGDLAGNLPAPTVAKIQGRAVDATAPSNLNVYLWNNSLSKWVPGFVDWANVANKPTFTSSNTANAVVQRDVSGNFSAGTITANLTGTASNASQLGGASSDANATNSTIVQRSSAGYIYGTYFNTSAADETGAFTRWYGGYDGYIRPQSNANAYKQLVTGQPHQINFVYGGSGSTNIDNVTVNNFWRSHAYTATVTEIACWTDANTVSLTIKDSVGNAIAGALTCAPGGASTSSINAYGAITAGEGLGFTTAAAGAVKNLSVSIKYNRSY